MSATHFQSPGPAPPGWGRVQHWQMQGATPSRSIFEADFGASEDSNLGQIVAGFVRRMARLPLSAPTLTRSGRVGSQFSSYPAAAFFNQLGNASGTGRNFSPGAVAATKRQINLNFNPNAQGAAELHPATTYDPFPTPGELYPKVV